MDGFDPTGAVLAEEEGAIPEATSPAVDGASPEAELEGGGGDPLIGELAHPTSAATRLSRHTIRAPDVFGEGHGTSISGTSSVPGPPASRSLRRDEHGQSVRSTSTMSVAWSERAVSRLRGFSGSTSTQEAVVVR